MLQATGDTIVPILKHILEACLRLNYIPTEWRTVNVVFIPKPGKDTYDTPKNFRPISLSSFLMKTLEKVIDYFLTEEGTKEYHPNQHAYRKGHSTDTALHQMVSKI